MKLNIVNVIGLVILSICFFFSCKKDVIPSHKSKHSFSLEEKWVAAKTFLWRDYVDSNVDKSKLKSATEKEAAKYSMFRVIIEAEKLYRSLLIDSLEVSENVFNDYYRGKILNENEDIIKIFKDSRITANLYQVYKNAESEDIKLNKKSNIDLPPANVNTCNEVLMYQDEVMNILISKGYNQVLSDHSTGVVILLTADQTLNSFLVPYNTLIKLRLDNVKFRQWYPVGCFEYNSNIRNEIYWLNQILPKNPEIANTGEGSGGGSTGTTGQNGNYGDNNVPGDLSDNDIDEFLSTNQTQALINNKLCPQTFQFSTVVAPGEGSPGWKQAAVQGIVVSTMSDSYFEAIWTTTTTGSPIISSTFNLEIGLPADIPNIHLSTGTTLACNLAMQKLLKKYKYTALKRQIQLGSFPFIFKQQVYLELLEAFPDRHVRVSTQLSGMVAPTTPVICP